MTLEAISSAVTVALASSVLILLAVWLWHFVSQPFAAASDFPDSIMVESAQRFRDQMTRLEREKTLYVTLSMMFVVTFGVSILLRPEDTFGALPTWKSLVVLVAAVVATLYVLHKVISIVIDRRRVGFIRDANISVGHSLQKLNSNQNRVFHEVQCAAGIIDNVVVGVHGIYAVCVLARRPEKDNRVQLNDEELSFSPGNQTVSISAFGHRTAQLAKTLRKRIGRDMRVRPVVALPGWEITSQASEKYLIVNERTLTMMQGWKNEKDYLMDEDVQEIHAFLSKSCTRSMHKKQANN